MLEAQRLLAGQEHSPQYRVERPRLDGGPEPGRDVLCGGVSLLSADPTLLDREVGPVAGRIEVLGAFDAGVLVDRKEAALVRGQAGYRRPLEEGQGNDVRCVDPLVPRSHDQLTPVVLVDSVAGVDCDSP